MGKLDNWEPRRRVELDKSAFRQMEIEQLAVFTRWTK